MRPTLTNNSKSLNNEMTIMAMARSGFGLSHELMHNDKRIKAALLYTGFKWDVYQWL
jgi:hypothetical protein